METPHERGIPRSVEPLALTAEEVLESVTDAFFFLDKQWRFAYLNAHAERLLAIDRASSLGRSVWELFPQAVGSEFDLQYQAAMATGERRSFAAFYPPYDMWFEVTAYPSERGLAVYFRDITSARREQETLRETVDAAPVFLSYLDRDLVYRFCNRAYEKFYDRPLNEIVGRFVGDMIGTEAFTFAEPGFRRALAGETVTDARWINYIDQGRRFMRMAYRPRWDEAGQVLGLYAMVIDETELQLAEERLRESEARLRLALSAARMAAWEYDPKTGAVTMSDQAPELLGVAPQHSDQEQGLIHPEDVESHWSLVRLAVDEGGRYFSRYRHLTPDNGVAWLEEHGQALLAPDGRTERLVGVVKNVTERKRAEDAVAESESHFRQMAESLPTITWSADPNGDTVWLSSRWFDYVGASPDEDLAGIWKRVLHPEDAEAAIRKWEESVARQKPHHAEFRLLGADGRYRWFLEEGRPIRSDSGEVIRWFGTTTDVQAQKDAEAELEALVRERTAELEQANRELEGFTYSVAHDLRAPLRAIDATSRILSTDLADTLSPEHLKMLERQSANVSKLAMLINDLLQHARLSRQPLTRTALDITAMAREVADAEAATYADRAFTIEIEPSLAAKADATAVRILLQNLLGNAMKYSPAGGRIEVARQGDTFFVRDQGIGFNPDYAERIFGAFERLHREDEFPGTGIGLANVRRLIERHGGKTWAESQPNQGSTFFFTLGE